MLNFILNYKIVQMNPTLDVYFIPHYFRSYLFLFVSNYPNCSRPFLLLLLLLYIYTFSERPNTIIQACKEKREFCSCPCSFELRVQSLRYTPTPAVRLYISVHLLNAK